jgi:hypothetical protein
MTACIPRNATGAIVTRQIRRTSTLVVSEKMKLSTTSCRRRSLWRLTLGAVALNMLAVPAIAQSSPGATRQPTNPNAAANAEQVAKILGISQQVADTRGLQKQAPCGSTPTVEELMMRQQVLETVEAASLKVDGVLAELTNERAHLSELSVALQARRDRAVNLANIANLITGTGLGIVVNSLQFSNSTANVGDAIGVGSGVASTALSLVAMRLQRGPQGSAGRIPNMLAPLFGKPGELNSYYPPEVMEYLESVPADETAGAGSRLEQLMTEWRQDGRLGPAGSPKTDQQIARLTSSLDDKTKLSIDDMGARMAMLADVTGRVGLMKRDLADLMLSVRGPRVCGP